MRCEVLAVGTELLLGQIVDTNSSWIGGQLALAGIDSHFQTKVGDNQSRIVACLRHALGRSEAVITCGGLGPTQDDITREAIAEVMGVALRRDDKMAAHVRNIFESRGRVMAENNLRQADLPEGAAFIAEMPGTAPGLVCPVGEKVIYAVPGVPHEMRTMLEGTVLPDLKRRAGITALIKSRVMRTWGNTESGLAELLAGRIEELDKLGNPTLAFQASGIEGLKVRITAKAADDAAAEAIIAEEEARVRAILGDCVFGVDDQTMESVVLDLLGARGRTLALAEALTGGIAGQRLGGLNHAGAAFKGSIVPSDALLSSPLLGAPAAPRVSAATAETLAAAAAKAMDADIGLASVGVAGPHESDGHQVGTAFFGLAIDGRTEARRVQLPGRGDRMRQLAVISMLNFLRQILLDHDTDRAVL